MPEHMSRTSAGAKQHHRSRVQARTKRAAQHCLTHCLPPEQVSVHVAARDFPTVELAGQAVQQAVENHRQALLLLGELRKNNRSSIREEGKG